MRISWVGNIECQSKIGWPIERSLASVPQDALRQFYDQPDLFGKRNRHVRRREFTIVRLPARKGLEPHKLTIFYVDQGLKKRNKFMVPDSNAQGLFQLGPTGDIFEHGRVKHCCGIASRSLGDIEGGVATPTQAPTSTCLPSIIMGSLMIATSSWAAATGDCSDRASTRIVNSSPPMRARPLLTGISGKDDH